jgi:hypothetical protein
VRIFVVKAFDRFRRREKLSNVLLRQTIDQIEAGLVDADLGGSLIKQRIARKGQGKSSGYRTLIAVKNAQRAVYLLGFAKSDRANLRPNELIDLRVLATLWLDLSNKQIAQAIVTGDLQEVLDE